MRPLLLVLGLLCVPAFPTRAQEQSLPAADQPHSRWGRLANPGADGHTVKTALYFTGQARDGTDAYGCAPSSNMNLYTAHPRDERHLKWSDNAANRDFALREFRAAGLNVVTVSSWGESWLPCTIGWPLSAPMQTSPKSHDELFDAAATHGLFIFPLIESRGDWSFRAEFPTTADGRVAPGTVSQVLDFIQRYIQNPERPQWERRFARIYDRDGQPRYAFNIIHVASDRLEPGQHRQFAAGLDAVADEVYKETKVRVGFTLDALPADGRVFGRMRISPEATGPFLKETPAFLGIQAFIPEIWAPVAGDEARIGWKREFSRGWHASGVPFLMDVTPGYDAHIVFPGSVRFGLNEEWLTAHTAMVRDYGSGGLMYNSWNGYTEAMTGLPTKEYGDRHNRWLRELTRIVPDRAPARRRRDD